MFGIHNFALFLTAGILLNLTPGPDTIYILGRSIAQGREAGVASAFGISIGSIFHTGAAALGLSAVLATSALAFRHNQVARWRVSDFPRNQIDSRPAKAPELAIQLSPADNDRRISPGRFDEPSESKSRALLSRVSSAIHRSDPRARWVAPDRAGP